MSTSKIIVAVAGFASALVFTGCSMCTSPIQNDPSCVESSHQTDKSVDPNILAFAAPKIAPCTDVFRPTFRAGNQRITVIGSGKSLEEATSDAAIKFMETAKCDYIVAVTRAISMKTHPTWRFFATTNYTVTFSGLPIYLDKVEKETYVEPKPVPPPVPVLTKEDIIQLIDAAIKKMPAPQPPQQPFGLVKLTDINVEIKAKGETPDHAGVAFPVK